MTKLLMTATIGISLIFLSLVSFAKSSLDGAQFGEDQLGEVNHVRFIWQTYGDSNLVVSIADRQEVQNAKLSVYGSCEKAAKKRLIAAASAEAVTNILNQAELEVINGVFTVNSQPLNPLTPSFSGNHVTPYLHGFMVDVGGYASEFGCKLRSIADIQADLIRYISANYIPDVFGRLPRD
jgi:hypothetical protein